MILTWNDFDFSAINSEDRCCEVCKSPLEYDDNDYSEFLEIRCNSCGYTIHFSEKGIDSISVWKEEGILSFDRQSYNAHDLKMLICYEPESKDFFDSENDSFMNNITLHEKFPMHLLEFVTESKQIIQNLEKLLILL